MATRLLRLGLLILGLIPLACGRHEGPEPTFDRLRRAIETQDGKAMFDLLSPQWQRLYLQWFEKDFASQRLDWLAGRLNWSRTQLEEAGPRGCLEAFLRTEGGAPYLPEYVREIRSTELEWKAPDRAWIVARPGRADMRPERHAYVFILEGGQWFWRPVNVPLRILLGRP
jgi:hypothetical protein